MRDLRAADLHGGPVLSRIRIRRAWKPRNDGPFTRPWYVERVFPDGSSAFITMERTHREAFEIAFQVAAG